MLQDLRDQKNSWLIVLLFAVIIIVFIFMFGLPGMDSFASKGTEDPASIGSHAISGDMLKGTIYKHYDDRVFGSAQYPSVAYSVTESLATIYLLADEARNAGLRVSDEELQDYITNWESGNPDIFRYGFLKQNEFDHQNYNNALARMMTSARDYEDFKRNELLARRYLTLLISSISVSDETLWQDFAEKNASASLDYIRLTPDAIRKTLKDLTDDEISAFMTASADDISNYYNEHLGAYTTQPKYKLHQIVIQKSLLKLTNPGEKTVKSYQPGERFAIARAQVTEKQLDFAQAFTDYDESEDKSLLGITGLLSIDIMSPELQNALEDKKSGDIVTAELSDRFIIAKVLENTEKIVTPLDDVKRDIAVKLLDERRVKSRTEAVSSEIIAQVQAGKALDQALNDVLYPNVLSEQPMIEVPVAPAAEPAVNGDTIGPDPDAAAIAAAPETILVPAETDQVVIPEYARLSVSSVADASTDTGFIRNIGVNDDLARDIRNSAANSLLAQSYSVGLDTIIVRVTEKKDASRDLFAASIEDLRQAAINEKIALLIGDPQAIIELTPNVPNGGRGVWVQQKLKNAVINGSVSINNSFFDKLVAKYQKQNQNN